MSRNRIGLIGLGFMGYERLRNYLGFDNAEVVALCSPSGRGFDGDFGHVNGNIGPSATRLELGAARRYTNPLELIKDPDIDAVDICTPTHTHEELVTAALEAGKHVICEKPLTRRRAEAERIKDAVLAHPNQVFMPAMCIRFWPEYEALLEIIRSRRFGNLGCAHFIRRGSMPTWGAHFKNGRESGGALFDLLIHDIDFGLAIGDDDKVPTITAHGSRGKSGGVDEAQIMLAFKRAGRISISGGWNVPASYGFKMHFEAHFPQATVELGDGGLLISEEGAPQKRFEAVAKETGWRRELVHFLQCIQDRSVVQRVTIADAVRAVEICCAVDALVA